MSSVVYARTKGMSMVCLSAQMRGFPERSEVQRTPDIQFLLPTGSEEMELQRTPDIVATFIVANRI